MQRRTRIILITIACVIAGVMLAAAALFVLFANLIATRR